MSDRVIRDAGTLEPGDQYVHVLWEGDPVLPEEEIVITILREREPWEDPFGREMFQYWATRSDTGAEGYVRFGPGGVVQAIASPAPTC